MARLYSAFGLALSLVFNGLFWAGFIGPVGAILGFAVSAGLIIASTQAMGKRTIWQPIFWTFILVVVAVAVLPGTGLHKFFQQAFRQVLGMNWDPTGPLGGRLAWWASAVVLLPIAAFGIRNEWRNWFAGEPRAKG